MTREEKIWGLLYEKIGNAYGVAAIMGNLMAESVLSPTSMTGKKASGYNPRSTYIDGVNNGSISRDVFSRDGIAFGLAQWCYWSRKQALYDYAVGKNIGSEETQIGYLLEEMPKYKKVWPKVINATDIQEPCDAVMLEYERPSGTSEAAKRKRRNYAEQFYQKYAARIAEEADLTTEEKVRIMWEAYNGH